MTATTSNLGPFCAILSRFCAVSLLLKDGLRWLELILLCNLRLEVLSSVLCPNHWWWRRQRWQSSSSSTGFYEFSPQRQSPLLVYSAFFGDVFYGSLQSIFSHISQPYLKAISQRYFPFCSYPRVKDMHHITYYSMIILSCNMIMQYISAISYYRSC